MIDITRYTAREYYFNGFIERLYEMKFDMDKDGFEKSAIMDFLDIGREYHQVFLGRKPIRMTIDGHLENYTIQCFPSYLFHLFFTYNSKIKDVSTKNVITYLNFVWYSGYEEMPAICAAENQVYLIELLDKLLENLKEGEKLPECPGFFETFIEKEKHRLEDHHYKIIEEWKSRFPSFTKSANKS